MNADRRERDSLSTLGERFMENSGQPILLNDKKICMAYRIPIRKGQLVTVEFLTSCNKVRQGIDVSVDKRKGKIEVNGQTLKHPVFWMDTAPSVFSFECHPSKREGQMNIWNIWQSPSVGERIDAWIGNAGLYVETVDEHSFLFHCSNGIGEINFRDLTFKITLE